MTYWPGTKIPVSHGNAFTYWKDGSPSILSKKNSVASQIKQGGYATSKEGLNIKKSFTIYTKA